MPSSLQLSLYQNNLEVFFEKSMNVVLQYGLVRIIEVVSSGFEMALGDHEVVLK